MARPTASAEDDDESSARMEAEVCSILEGSSSSQKVKKLRKHVFLALQLDDTDKVAKKQFKRIVQALETSGKIQLNDEGLVTILSGSDKKRKKNQKSPKDDKKNDKRIAKKSRLSHDDGKEKADNEDDEADSFRDSTEEAQQENLAPTPAPAADKNKPCKGNPQGVTRLFLGNLPFAVDESSLKAFFSIGGEVTHIKWITDKDTGKFYGSAFIEMENSRAAAQAVAMAGSQLMGRPIKVNFAPARPGDVWPPAAKVMSGGSAAKPATTTTGGQAGGQGVKAMRPRPVGCVKLFIGNLSYDIDDEGITKFFANVDAEVKAVRWLHHEESGDFKGCGFVDFWNPEACEKAATLNGKTLLGRPIRIDWTE